MKERWRIQFLRASSQVPTAFGFAPEMFICRYLPRSHCTELVGVNPNSSPRRMWLHFPCHRHSLLHTQSELLDGGWMWISFLLGHTWEHWMWSDPVATNQWPCHGVSLWHSLNWGPSSATRSLMDEQKWKATVLKQKSRKGWKAERVHGDLDPSKTTARIWGAKMAKASSGSILLCSCQDQFLAPCHVAAAAGILPPIVLVYRTSL